MSGPGQEDYDDAHVSIWVAIMAVAATLGALAWIGAMLWNW